jgi:hypothetical protein
MQKDFQALYAHPSWKDVKLGGITAAWYERELSVPSNWANRRISLNVEYLNSYAAVFVDGIRKGEIYFPGGEVDLSAACGPGTAHRLSLLVVALPLKGVMLSYTDSASAREVKGKVERRGLCGDVYLVSTPRGPKITDVSMDTAVRKRELTVSAAIDGLEPNSRYNLRARIMKDGSAIKEFASPPLQGSDLRDGRFTLTEKWLPDKLWDINTPQNTFDLRVPLTPAVWFEPIDATFGFRSSGLMAGTSTSTGRAYFFQRSRSTMPRSAPRLRPTKPHTRASNASRVLGSITFTRTTTDASQVHT